MATQPKQRMIEIKDINFGGIADSDYQGLPNSVKEVVGLDIHSEPGIIRVQQALVKESGGVVTEFCKVGITCSDGNAYLFSDTSGKIWKRSPEGLYTLVYTTVPESGTARCLGAREYGGYIYWTTQNNLHRVAVSKTSNWNSNAELNWKELNLIEEERGNTADGYLLKNAVIEDILGFQLHTYSVTGSAQLAVGEADSTTKKKLIFQTFQTYGETMTDFSFYKQADTGTFTGDVVFSIRNCALITGGAAKRYQPMGDDLISIKITNAQWKQLPVGWNKIALSYTFNTITSQAKITEPVLFQSAQPGMFTTLGVAVALPAPVNPYRYIPQMFVLVINPTTADNSNCINLEYGTGDYDTQGRLGTYNTADGWTYTDNSLNLAISFQKNNVNKMIFSAKEVTQLGFKVNIKTVGTVTWRFTCHDKNNNVMATKDVAYTNLVQGWNTILWTTPWAAILHDEYHIHILTTT